MRSVDPNCLYLVRVMLRDHAGIVVAEGFGNRDQPRAGANHRAGGGIPELVRRNESEELRLGAAHHGHFSRAGRSHARAMLVEVARAAAKAPGPLHAFVRIRAKGRGQFDSPVWRESQ
jgi:hypothetical protein